jgi:putative endonuclease
MTFARLGLGKRGEAHAVAYLRAKGYRLLCENYTTKIGEIDCIFMDGDELVFVEVKTRTSTAFGDPLEAVGQRKWHQITRVAELYLARHETHGPIRFDVIGIIDGKPPHIDHIKNAFEGF